MSRMKSGKNGNWAGSLLFLMLVLTQVICAIPVSATGTEIDEGNINTETPDTPDKPNEPENPEQPSENQDPEPPAPETDKGSNLGDGNNASADGAGNLAPITPVKPDAPLEEPEIPFEKPNPIVTPPTRPTNSKQHNTTKILQTALNYGALLKQQGSIVTRQEDSTEANEDVVEDERSDDLQNAGWMSEELQNEATRLMRGDLGIAETTDSPWKWITLWLVLIVVLCAFAGVTTALISASAISK